MWSTVIRNARDEDTQILERLFEEFSGWHLERLASIRRAIKDPAGEMLVAEIQGQIVGILHQVFFEDPLHGGPNSMITDVFVREQHQRKGIGSQLLDKALETARNRKVREVHVTTHEENTDAMKFYKKHGFCRSGILLENSFE